LEITTPCADTGSVKAHHTIALFPSVAQGTARPLRAVLGEIGSWFDEPARNGLAFQDGGAGIGGAFELPHEDVDRGFQRCCGREIGELFQGCKYLEQRAFDPQHLCQPAAG
jgi:hypothetical protein